MVNVNAMTRSTIITINTNQTEITDESIFFALIVLREKKQNIFSCAWYQAGGKILRLSLGSAPVSQQSLRIISIVSMQLYYAISTIQVPQPVLWWYTIQLGNLTMQYHAVPYNTRKYNTITCNSYNIIQICYTTQPKAYKEVSFLLHI